MSAAKQNLQVQKWVAGISIALLLVKFAAYYFTRSVSILTDALESIVNVAAGLIGLYSLFVAAKPRDRDHPYGHGKAEFLSAAVEGTMIGIAGVIIIYKSVQQFIYPTELARLDLGIILVSSTALVNLFLGVYCVRIGRKNSSLALIASGKHLQTDTISTLGIVAGLVVIYFTGWDWIDGVIAICFGLFIIYMGYRILRRSIAGIMDEADEKLVTKLAELLEQQRQTEWVDLHNLRVIKYGAVLHIDCHLTVPWYFNVHEAHVEIDQLAAIVRGEFGETVELFVHSDGCLPFQCPICNKADCPVRQHNFVKRIPWTLENISQDEKHRLKEDKVI